MDDPLAGCGELLPWLTEHVLHGVQKRKRSKEEKKEREWRHTELKALEDNLLLFGDGNTSKLRSLVCCHDSSPVPPFTRLLLSQGFLC